MNSNVDLKNMARIIRQDILISLTEAGSGHLGGSLGLADIFTVLYFKIMDHRFENSEWPLRDRLILSIGHVAPVLYATLAHAGYFPKEELLTLRKLGSRLQGHPAKEKGLPGIEISSGSLGQGLSVSVGLALAARYDKEEWKTYCVMGDGELQEGSVWEAAMSASHHKLGNIIAIADRNNCQIDGKTSQVMELEPLEKKWEAFGWKVFSCNGNNMDELIKTFESAKGDTNVPKIIIAQTKMGKGVRSIEDDHHWHGKVPSKEELPLFIKELTESYINEQF